VYVREHLIMMTVVYVVEIIHHVLIVQARQTVMQ
jgi:hypothetical protein